MQIETPANASQSKHIALKYPDGSAILDGNGAQVYAVDRPQYLGPTIVAQKNRPVRVKFTNYLPAGAAGNLFLPVDTTIMGAGMGPNGGDYTQNRATLHLHGGTTPWISDGTPFQWTTPGADATQYTRGASVQFVPDMWFDNDDTPDRARGDGRRDQRSRPRLADLLLHEPAERPADVLPRPRRRHHALNVYAGEAAPYVLQDPVEQDFVKGTNSSGANPGLQKVIPATQIPLVIQDKTFVPNAHAARQRRSDLGHDQLGRQGQSLAAARLHAEPEPRRQPGRQCHGALGLQLVVLSAAGAADVRPGPQPAAGTTPLEGAFNPGTPTPSIVPEAFMDTPLVNGVTYPFLKVGRHAYRFRILNASDDRTLNLQLYYAKPTPPCGTPTAP